MTTWKRTLVGLFCVCERTAMTKLRGRSQPHLLVTTVANRRWVPVAQKLGGESANIYVHVHRTSYLTRFPHTVRWGLLRPRSNQSWSYFISHTLSHSDLSGHSFMGACLEHYSDTYIQHAINHPHRRSFIRQTGSTYLSPAGMPASQDLTHSDDRIVSNIHPFFLLSHWDFFFFILLLFPLIFLSAHGILESPESVRARSSPTSLHMYFKTYSRLPEPHALLVHSPPFPLSCNCFHISVQTETCFHFLCICRSWFLE